MSNTQIAIHLLHVLENTEAQRDDLLEALEGLMILEPELWNDIRVKESFEKAKAAIAKAKEQSCSTLCHPEEECFITESGKCEAKGE